MSALVRVWDQDLNVVYQLADGETLSQGYVELHRLGAALLQSDETHKYVATTDSEDGNRIVQQIQSVSITNCSCGNRLATATWV